VPLGSNFLGEKKTKCQSQVSYFRKQCLFPMKQNEVIEEQKKFLENQLSQRVKKVPKGKQQLFFKEQ
jgi:hypothetical protein